MQAEKFAIRAAFGRAAHSYDAVAALQRRVADRLMTMSPLGAENVVLDAGCGTGYGIRRLMAFAAESEQNAYCIALDTAQEMAMVAASGARRTASCDTLCADIEALPLAARCIDLYWSSLAWQWVEPQQAIAEAARVLRPGGKLRVATLGQQTLHELHAAFATTDNTAHVRRFTPAEDYQGWLLDAGFSEYELTRETITVFAADLRALLHELKALGAHVIGESRRHGLLGRHAWQRIDARYEALRSAQGLPATYDVIYLCATKKTVKQP